MTSTSSTGLRRGANERARHGKLTLHGGSSPMGSQATHMATHHVSA
jgi:hypothetical protein